MSFQSKLRPGLVILANRFKPDATDSTTGVTDEDKLAELIAEYARANRDQYFSPDDIGQYAVRKWKDLNSAFHRQRIKRGEIYCPIVAVPLPKRQSIEMRKMRAPQISLWNEVLSRAHAGGVKLLESVKKQSDFCVENLTEMAQHRRLKTLHDVRVQRFGYIEKPEDAIDLASCDDDDKADE